MIHYHGGPITPDTCAMKAWKARHAFISFENPGQLGLAAEICQSFALDNGAFSAWKKAGKNRVNWDKYYEFVQRWGNHPGCDFAIIPDVIDGGAEENDALLADWPHGLSMGVPVWHMNESDDRFIRLCHEYPRVAIGSCGEYDVKSPTKAVIRLKDIIRHVVDAYGQPIAKLHGLRMLNPDIFTKLPLSSADSTNIAQNIGKDQNWRGTYQPQSKETRAYVMAERIENHNSAGSLNYCEERDRFSIQLPLEV
ncbi:hypothetical protein ACSJLX_001942 [Serratia marcescens]